MVTRRNVIRLVGGGVVVAAGAGWGISRLDAMPPAAVEAWSGPRADEPDVRRWAVAHAILAPNPHNMQPWLVDLREPGVIVLHVDTGRLLPETDPFGRQVMIGQGAFLELLLMALAERGQAVSLETFPDGQDDAAVLPDARPVARLELRTGAAAARDPLFAQALRRRSTKQPYDLSRPVADTELAALRTALPPAGVALGFATAAEPVAALRQLTREAMEIELATPRTLAESIDRLRIGADAIARHRDGIELHGPMVWALRHAGLMTREALLTPGTLAYDGGRDYALGSIDGTPAYGWLTTAANDRHAQLEAGRAYLRQDLAAAAAGLAVHPNSQALQEFPEMDRARVRLAELIDLPPGHTAQMLWRLGHAPRVAPTPRRRLDDILLPGSA